MLDDGGELALIDVREELIFSQSHLLLARSVPLSRFELKFAPLVPRRATRIVLCDDGDGLAPTRGGDPCAQRLHRCAHPRRRRRGLGRGGLRAVLRRQRAEQGVRRIYRARQATRPTSPPANSKSCIRDGADLVVLDSRPFDEYSRVSIPTATNVPGAELVLRARDIAPSPRHDGRRQLRRPHPQHHRRAIADQCRPAEQGRGAAQRHHGLEPRRLCLRQRQEPPRAGRFAENARLGAASGATRGARAAASRRIDRATLDAWRDDDEPHALRFRRARSAPNTKPATSPARSRRPAANWCRRPINMSARSARASCWSTMPKSARR